MTTVIADADRPKRQLRFAMLYSDTGLIGVALTLLVTGCSHDTRSALSAPTPPHIPPEAFSGTVAGDERTVGGVRLSWCPAGRFRMGSPAKQPGRRADEGPVDVVISRGFWAGKFEVTQGQWKRVVGARPGELTERGGGGEDLTVYHVSYPEAEMFRRKLTGQARAAGELPAGWAVRLPTEAQWEYACRAGTTTATAFGDSLGRTQANFKGRPYNGAPDAGPSLSRATPVGSYPANAWGLHDCHENAFEWCRDWYHAALPGGVDPDLSAEPGTVNRDGTFSRARRGGAWDDDGVFCRSALRLRFEPERRSDHIGFRVVVERE